MAVFPADMPITAVGGSEAFLAFEEAVSRAAKADRPVLIVGERGTGKELAASRLHFHSPRWQGPLVTLNCAALTPSLLESEIFGHEAGAFTGAVRRRLGRFELAHHGTLFLDEISRMPLELQEKILRAVEYGVFERVGGEVSVRVDVRLVAAANEDLPNLASTGRFRADLLDRLSFLVLTAPPLRARGEDMLLLAGHFARNMAVELGRDEVPVFHPLAQAQLLAHGWPGNVRELKNAVERAVFLADGGEIRQMVLDPFASPYRPMAMAPAATGSQPIPKPDTPPLDTPLPEQVRSLKLALLRQALAATRHNQRAAAQLLGISYHAFRALYRGYKSDVEAHSAMAGKSES